MAVITEAVHEVTTGPYANAFSPDTDDREMWEAMKSQDSTRRGIAGLDLVGKGRGGGAGSTDDMASTRRTVRVGAVSVQGPRSAHAVAAFVRGRGLVLKRCYAGKATRKHTLTLEITTSGRVRRADLSGNVPKAAARCITEAARGWRFPKVPGRASRASVPLSF